MCSLLRKHSTSNLVRPHPILLTLYVLYTQVLLSGFHLSLYIYVYVYVVTSDIVRPCSILRTLYVKYTKNPAHQEPSRQTVASIWAYIIYVVRLIHQETSFKKLAFI